MSTQKTTTPLTDLIAQLTDLRDAQMDNEGWQAVQESMNLAQSLLSKERETIEDAFIDGKNEGNNKDVMGQITGSDYYTQTFDQHGTR